MTYYFRLNNTQNYTLFQIEQDEIIYRASKSPDLAGDLPIFDKIMKISRSPDLEWKSS